MLALRSLFVLVALVAAATAVDATAVEVPPPSPAAQEEPSITVTDRLEVRRKLLEVRVVDGLGRPVEGLTADDFEVEIGGRPARVEAVDRVIADGYLGATLPSPSEDRDAGVTAAFDPRIAQPRQLVVLFFQTSLQPSKAVGFFRLHRHVDEMIAALPPDVAAAVVAFDSHLKIHQDFTLDRAALQAAVERAMGFTPAAFPDVPPEGVPSLARGIERRAARRAARAEDGLALVAEALAPLPGEKAMVFLGWGIGRFGGGSVTLGQRYEDARAALVQARVPVFALNVTDADVSSIDLTLRALADDTGGHYFATNDFPGRAVHSVERTLRGGRYLLLVETPDLGPGWHRLSVRTSGPWSFELVLAPAGIHLAPPV